MRHDFHDLIELFANLFLEAEKTVLVRGGSEPRYDPWGSDGEPAAVVFAHGFFASALHEVAHWSIAGRRRRAEPDYGYWYDPDGRSADRQRDFERVEVKPQALEWVFSVAAGSAFHFSADNLGPGGSAASEAWDRFRQAVQAQAVAYARGHLPPRARRFVLALAERYGTGSAWENAERYLLF